MKRNKVRFAFVATLIGLGLGTALSQTAKEDNLQAVEATNTLSIAQEAQWALEMVNRPDLYVSEDFVITEKDIEQLGDIRGEKVQLTGEGIYLTKQELEDFNLHLEIGDVVRATWTMSNYWNENWEFERIQILGHKKD